MKRKVNKISIAIVVMQTDKCSWNWDIKVSILSVFSSMNVFSLCCVASHCADISYQCYQLSQNDCDKTKVLCLCEFTINIITFGIISMCKSVETNES